MKILSAMSMNALKHFNLKLKVSEEILAWNNLFETIFL